MDCNVTLSPVEISLVALELFMSPAAVKFLLDSTAASLMVRTEVLPGELSAAAIRLSPDSIGLSLLSFES